jgi:hypothetical protein
VKSYVAAHPGHPSQLSVATAQVNGFQDALFVAAFFPLITSLVALLFVKMYHVDESAEPAVAV